jgi:branched-chain amino acid transport system substrate-binding protein
MSEADESKTWRVGILFSNSGVTSVIEQSQHNGALLAIEEVNAGGGVAGRRIEPIVYDPQSIVSEYGRLAERLIVEDQARVIFGCYMSSARKEVLPVIERRNALFFYPTLYEGFEYSPNVFYGGATPNQNSVPLARYLMSNYGNRFYFVGSDYIYPRESNRVMRNIVRQGGGDVVGERYVALQASQDDFEEIIADIHRTGPDVIFSTVVGQGTINFYRAFHRAGFDAGRMPIGSLTTNEAEIAEMGVEAAVGHITAAPYFRNVASEANAAFLDRYLARFGSVTHVTSCCEATYFQVHLFARALAKTRCLDTDLLREALLGAVYDAPQGLVKVDPDNSHTYLQSRIAKVDRSGEFVIEQEARRSIKPDPYLVNPGLDDWSLRLHRPARARKRQV